MKSEISYPLTQPFHKGTTYKSLLHFSPRGKKLMHILYTGLYLNIINTQNSIRITQPCGSAAPLCFVEPGAHNVGGAH